MRFESTTTSNHFGVKPAVYVYPQNFTHQLQAGSINVVITVFAFGKLKKTGLREIASDYISRIRAWSPISELELKSVAQDNLELARRLDSTLMADRVNKV